MFFSAAAAKYIQQELRVYCNSDLNLNKLKNTCGMYMALASGRNIRTIFPKTGALESERIYT